mmetsp:Transcript_19259/g.26955  ORF Transcript_19259/g.26955 Transcript_19259/m.26955 type:complete len:232 (-) Transcript_19259:1366-2061(-)
MLQFGSLLRLVALHPSQHIIQQVNSLQNVWTLVQHHALCSGRHGSIRDFSSRGCTLLSHCFQHLGSPDDRYMGSFSDPQNLFLELSQQGVSTFHSEVTTSNHDTKREALHSSQKNAWKAFKSSPCFNFEDDWNIGFASLQQLFMKHVDVARVIHKGQANEVCVIDNVFQIHDVLSSQAWQSQVALRKVDTFVTGQVGASRFSMGNVNRHLVKLHRIDHTPNLAIIKPDRLA